MFIDCVTSAKPAFFIDIFILGDKLPVINCFGVILTKFWTLGAFNIFNIQYLQSYTTTHQTYLKDYPVFPLPWATP